MTSFLKLQEFYKRLTGTQDLPKTESGHFNIVRVEDLALSEPKSIGYARRSYFKISLVHGHSKIHYSTHSTEIRQDALVFTNPQHPYHWERISAEQQGVICIFTEDFLSHSGKPGNYPVFKFPENAVIQLTPAQSERFTIDFQRMKAELNVAYVFKYDLLRCLLLELILEAQKLQPLVDVKPAGSTAHERIAVAFTALLEQQFPLQFSNQRIELQSPADFAGQLRLHVNHLNKALKEITGTTTSVLINSRIIHEAKILLRNTDWSVSEIGWVLGFDEPNHFSAAFRRHTNQSPKQYRNVKND